MQQNNAVIKVSSLDNIDFWNPLKKKKNSWSRFLPFMLQN